MGLKLLFSGILLLAAGILIAYVEFGHPEIFFGWFGLGLAGPLVWGLFLLLIIVGIGFIYGGFGKEEVPQLAPPIDALVDQRIDIEGAQRVAEEISLCKKYFLPNEKLLAIIMGDVDGKPELNRLALTDNRIIFYSRDNSQSAILFDYEQIDTVRGKKGKVLTHLGEINLYMKGQPVRFRNMLEEYVDHILDIIHKMRQKKS
jgi:hypothetical protein